MEGNAEFQLEIGEDKDVIHPMFLPHLNLGNSSPCQFGPVISIVTPVYPWPRAVTGRQFHKYMNPSRIPWLELTPLCQGWKLFIKVVIPVADPGDPCRGPVGLSHMKSMTCNSSLHRQVRQVDALQPCSQM